MLHTWFLQLRNRRFRRALAMRAILCVPVLVRASLAAQAALTGTLPPSLKHPSICHEINRSSMTLTVGDDIIADGVSLLYVVSECWVRESPYVPSADKHRFISQSATTATTGTAQSGWSQEWVAGVGTALDLLGAR